MSNAKKSLRIAALAGFGLLALSATPVLAAPVSGFVTANVNERSGPSTSYPPITVIPAGSPIIIYGCLSDDSWCDISWGPNRGWMSSAYLQVNYQSRRVPLRSYSGIPFITFNFGSYWDNHYRGRPFFNQRSKWSNFHWQQGGPDRNNDHGPNKPPKPPKNMGNNNQHDGNPPNYGGNNTNGGFGNNNGQKFGDKGRNGPGYGKPPKGQGPNKNCIWKDGKLVCGPPQMQP